MAFSEIFRRCTCGTCGWMDDGKGDPRCDGKGGGGGGQKWTNSADEKEVYGETCRGVITESNRHT